MKRIPLTRGKFAIVDDEDYEWLNQWKWYAQKHHRTWYAKRAILKNGKLKTIYMHRQIVNAQKGQETDHKDGNGLHNQRSNLRFCTGSQNQMNKKMQKNCSSEFKGVYLGNRLKRWRARIFLNKKQFHLGYFDKEKDAAKAYNKVAKKYFGEFARLNNV